MFDTAETCEARFEAGQVRELTDPDYFAVHQFSVPAFMLQHNRYSRQGWLVTRRLLAQQLAGATPAETVRANRRALDSGKRTYSITRGPKLAGIDRLRWTCTVADVRLDSAEHYCADVRAWAESVVRDSAALAREADPAR